MPKIIFKDTNDLIIKKVDAKVGWSLMETALENQIPGILGECVGVAPVQLVTFTLKPIKLINYRACQRLKRKLWNLLITKSTVFLDCPVK